MIIEYDIDADKTGIQPSKFDQWISSLAFFRNPWFEVITLGEVWSCYFKVLVA